MPPVTAGPRGAEAWLEYLAQLNPDKIELGLERVRAVLGRLKPDFSGTLIVEIAGTNGKGSTAALTAAILTAAGVKTALYTSPHLLRFNERVSVDGREISDTELAEAFEAVYAAAAGTPLTYFEFATLAALRHFAARGVRVLVLEAGLGGRLDAVNALDADLALITSIGLDHTRILGSTLARIAFEKAGIIKPGSVCLAGAAAPEALAVIERAASERGAGLLLEGRDFGCRFDEKTRYFERLEDGGTCELSLSLPKVPRPCAALAVRAARLIALRLKLRLDAGLLSACLERTALPGRLERIRRAPAVYADVAHNPPAAGLLAREFAALGGGGRSAAVIGMLSDKDVEGTLAPLAPLFDGFYLASLPGGRGERASRLARALLDRGIPEGRVHCYDSVQEAYGAALADAAPEDTLLVTGSFVTVAGALKFTNREQNEQDIHD